MLLLSKRDIDLTVKTEQALSLTVTSSVFPSLDRAYTPL